MAHFIFKSIPPRTTFPADIMDDENRTMEAHLAYGPVLAPKGVRSFGPACVAGSVLALAGCLGPNHVEQLASDVTKAIVANDMRPVAPDFNAIPRAKLSDRGYVGHLSDELNALGAFKGVKEDTPSSAPQGIHHLSVTFDKATWQEELELDSDGKIAHFKVYPPGPTP
jgi:hypothetical protein